MQENEMIALVLLNVERAEHHLPPCALTDLNDADLNRYLARATAVQTAVRTAIRATPPKPDRLNGEGE